MGTLLVLLSIASFHNFNPNVRFDSITLIAKLTTVFLDHSKHILDPIF